MDPSLRHDPIHIRKVTPEYFDTFRIRVRSGRAFAATDRDSEPVAVLTESARRILFPGEPAVGRRIRFVTRGPWHLVVGVADDLRNGGEVTAEPAPEAYVVAPRDDWSANGHLALRTMAAPGDAEAFLRRIAADLDPLLPVAVERLDAQVARLTERPRFTAWLLSAFAGLALLLAAAGLYSVAAYLVTQRRRDIGVRIAMGASPRDVARQVVSEAGRWIIGGALLGSVLGWMGTRALQSQLYQVEALDPWSWTLALLALSLVLVIAVFRPAYRAAHVDPVTALRAE
jgi:putative ABC transport system permease protein